MSKLFIRIKTMIVEVGDCWEWQGALQHRSPVPVMNYNNQVQPVRRHIARELGIALQGKFATYRCGNPICVNPDHVIVVTRKRLQQRIAKEKMYASSALRRKKLSDLARQRGKLTAEQAQAIRDAEGSQREIAARFGVSQATVSVIKRGKTWQDYSNPFAGLLGGKR